MPKEEVRTAMAPRAIGPYSQAVKADRYLFVSGQIPVEPNTGDLVTGSVEAETRQVLTNIQMILEAAGFGLKDVVKTTVYMKDLSAFAGMNGVYGEFFAPPYPARATVEVRGLPKGVSVEIDAIAVKGD